MKGICDMPETQRKRRSKFTKAILPQKYTRSKKVIEILKVLHPDAYSMLTTQQIYQLCFKKGSKAYCDEILRHMYHRPLQLVNRHAFTFTKGLNNASLFYTISRKGSQLLYEKNLGRVITPQKAYKMKNSKNLYREHEKGLNDVRIAIVKGAEKIGAVIETWISDSDFKKPKIRKQLRVQDQKTGEIFGFEPDGFFVLRLPTGERKPFFLEYDNNTTFHKRFQRIKIQGYHLLGDIWRKLPVFVKYKDIQVTYRVLTVTNAGVDRAFHFKQQSVEALFVKDNKRELHTRRFYFTQADLVVNDTIFTEPIWFIPFKSKTQNQKFAIFESKLV